MTVLPPLFISLRITVRYLSPNAEMHTACLTPAPGYSEGKEVQHHFQYSRHSEIVIYRLLFYLIIIKTQMHKEVARDQMHTS